MNGTNIIISPEIQNTIFTIRGELVTNCDRFENIKHSSSNLYAFTEQGVAMLITIIRKIGF